MDKRKPNSSRRADGEHSGPEWDEVWSCHTGESEVDPI